MLDKKKIRDNVKNIWENLKVTITVKKFTKKLMK